MPKQLYLEEVINRVISLTKFELKNNIFPEYDPLYRESDPNGKMQCIGHYLYLSLSFSKKLSSVFSQYDCNEIMNIL